MKIKMMDLFKLMLERKAPKKIRVLGINMTFIETAEWGDYVGDYDCRLSGFRLIDCLNEDVEIIEEPKEIEKMECDVESWFSPTQADIEIIKKVNEIIDEINNLKEKKL